MGKFDRLLRGDLTENGIQNQLDTVQEYPYPTGSEISIGPRTKQLLLEITLAHFQ